MASMRKNFLHLLFLICYIQFMNKAPKANSTLNPQRVMIIDKLPAYFLILCLSLSFYYLFQILTPFLAVIFIAAVLSITFYPLYVWMLKTLRGWERTASFITCLIVILITVVPLVGFSLLMAGEAVETYETIQVKVNSGVFDKYLQWENGGFFYDLNENVQSVVDVGKLDVKKTIVDVAQSLSSFLVEQAANLVKSLSDLFLNFFLMLFSMFYFFKDGKRLIAKVGSLSPLPSLYESQLFSKISAMSKAIMVGVFLTAILQGLAGGIGFAIAGISNPVFWGTAIAFFSLVPLFGTAVIWVPAAIILAILGSYGGAIFIFVWGVVVIGLVDNVARPFLIGGKAHTYPLLTFFVIMGGIWTMGLKGVIIGPLVLMVLMSFLHIYQAEYSKVLKN